MRKPGFFVLLIFLAGFHAAGQTANYPDIINNGTIFLNTGIGFGRVHGKTKYDEHKTTLIPLIVSADMAIPIASLPFTLGLAFAFSKEEGSIKDNYNYSSYSAICSSDNMGFALRTGYHFGWGINRFDTYINLTLGAIRALEDEKWTNHPAKKARIDDPNWLFWFQAGIGARYFFHRNIGVNAEFALGNFYNFSLSMSWRI